MSQATTKPATAGIDVAKRTLELAITGSTERLEAPNDASGHALIADRLRAFGVRRVGLEASGHYEAAIAAFLRQRGFAVLVLDPCQIQGWRRFQKRRAKTDPIDAALIAEATASVKITPPPPDPRLAPLAEHLTFIEQISEDIARFKTRRDRYTDPTLKRSLEAAIKRLTTQRKQSIAKLVAMLRRQPDLAHRLDLLLSIPGVGEISAASLVIRMPELGSVTREQAAALLGVAPINADSGEHQGTRHIGGGRARLRRAVFLAAFTAENHWNSLLQATYTRLRAAGKHHTLATVACARKLIILANPIIARNTPWQDQAPARPSQITALVA